MSGVVGIFNQRSAGKMPSIRRQDACATGVLPSPAVVATAGISVLAGLLWVAMGAGLLPRLGIKLKPRQTEPGWLGQLTRIARQALNLRDHAAGNVHRAASIACWHRSS